MAAERFTPRDETDEGLADEFRGGKRDWRRWWESKAEAFDPEKWKAMASVWSGLLQDAAKEAQGGQGSSTATKTCPYCAEEIKQAAIKCKHCTTWLAPIPEGARYEYISGQGAMDPRLSQRVRLAPANSFYRGCDGSWRIERCGTFLWSRPNLATDCLCPWDDLHGDRSRHRCLCDTDSHHPRERSRQRPGPGVGSRVISELCRRILSGVPGLVTVPVRPPRSAAWDYHPRYR